jgi:hypothetical protein
MSRIETNTPRQSETDGRVFAWHLFDIKAHVVSYRIAATRRITARKIARLPAILRRDLGLPDRSSINRIELSHQFYSLD